MGSSQSSYEYRIGESAQERGLPYVPDCYHISPEQRPALSSSHVQMANVPLFDLGGLRGTPEQRAALIKDIGNACRQKGFFQVIKHESNSKPILHILIFVCAYYKMQGSRLTIIVIW